MKTKKNRVISALILLIGTFVYGQNGYIYVHKKAISELSSLNFSYHLKQGNSTVKNFSLNDQPNALNAFDLGNSHGNGEGQLWAVINDSNSNGSTHNITGTLYTRPNNSTQWAATTVTDSRSVDGIDADTAIYSDGSGAVFLYNSGVSTKIWTPGSNGNVQIIDVASGGSAGILAVVGNNGKIYKYTGTGTTDSWAVYTSALIATAFRLDLNPTNQEIVFAQTSDSNIYKLAGASASAVPAIIAAPLNTTLIGNSLRDIAVSNAGTIYSNYSNSVGSPNVYEYTTSWQDNARSRGMSGLTAGMQNQVWGINKVNADIIKHTIFTRVSTGLWLDDERVRTDVANGNSIIIPVAAGTYTLAEAADSGWNNSEITVYDPTNNSSSNVGTSVSTINVAPGEVVHIVYSNVVENSIVTPTVCATNYLITFGNGTPAYGAALNGFTSYHYLANGVLSDGYYSLVKNSSGWYANGNLTLQNRTPSDPNGYFAMFNASYNTDDFFRQTVTGLSVGTVYEFAFWVADLSPATAIRPNVTMGILNPSTGTVINSIDTGDISSTVWKQYKFEFTATSTTGEIFLKNNSIGGSGNDLAIDDITFAPLPLQLDAITTATTSVCSNKSVPEQYSFGNSKSGGTWSVDRPDLLILNSTTGSATTVFGAVGTAIITYSYTSPSGCLSTTSLPVTIDNCVCYAPASTAAAVGNTNHGITLLPRAGAGGDNWPMSRKSAHTVLESNRKGFVITRIPTSGLSLITDPVDGMMVYDTTAKCLKIYTTDALIPANSAWNCFLTPTCP